MPWFWTDDLARLLLAAGLSDEASLRSWLSRPTAISAPEDADPLAVGRRLAGIGEEAAGAA